MCIIKLSLLLVKNFLNLFYKFTNMIYEIGGRYGEFTLEAETDLLAITLCYLITPDGSAFIRQPEVEQFIFHQVDSATKFKELYLPSTQKEYLLQNAEVLKSVVSNYLPGSRFKRDETTKLLLDFDEAEKTDMFKTLRQTYMDDRCYELDNRIKKVVSMLNFLKKHEETI